jgi:hypothetical protein
MIATRKMLDIKSLALVAFIAFTTGSFGSWYLTSSYKESKYSAVISKMREDAAIALHQATVKAMEIASENSKLATELEVQSAENRDRLDQVSADNRRLADELGGLYDSQATCGDSTPSPNPSASAKPATPPTGVRLSKEASAFLLAEARRADQAATYAETCYQWIRQINAK